MPAADSRRRQGCWFRGSTTDNLGAAGTSILGCAFSFIQVAAVFRPPSGMESPTPGWIQTLAIALITSFSTVCLIEPIRSMIQRWVRRREVRRGLYHEMVLNFRQLDGQVQMAKRDPEMKAGMSEHFGRYFRKTCFDLAQHDPITYYGLSFKERYWIELYYSGMESIVKGRFTNDEQCLSAASFASDYLLTYIKNRYISKRLLFSVSPVQLRKYLRERLPDAHYVDVTPPSRFERLRRRLD